MLVRVPFPYSAVVIGKGKRKPETQFFWEWLDLEIAEPDDLEAPVALRWRDAFPADDPGFADRHKWGLFPADGLCESRWFDGSHWMPVLVEDSRTRASAERMPKDDLVRRCAEGNDRDNPLVPFFHETGAAGNPAAKPIDYEDYRTVQSCGREAQVQALTEKARNLIVADGAVWRQTAEPVCYLKEWVHHGHSYQAAIKVLPCDSTDITDPCQVYRADRFDEAAEAAILRGDHADGEVEVMNLPRRVEVLVPESVRYRDEEKALDHSVYRLLCDYSDKPLKELHPDLAAGWFALRSAFEADDHFDLVEGALEDFLHSLPEDTRQKRYASRALERWRSRPIWLADEEVEASASLKR